MLLHPLESFADATAFKIGNRGSELTSATVLFALAAILIFLFKGA
jgi:hypothetical protein